MNRCQTPPAGWYCTRVVNHPGPCAAHPVEFPLLYDHRTRKPSEYPSSIPWTMLAKHENQAIENHDQSLWRLAERGGLSPLEALYVMRDKPLRGIWNDTTTEAQAVEELLELVDKWKLTTAS